MSFKSLKVLVIISLSAIFMYPMASSAETRLPEVMVGQARVELDGETYYGGMNGNQAVINFDGPVIGFNEDYLTHDNENLSPGCYYDEWFDSGISPCFQMDPDNSSIKVMTSRTRVNGVEVLELATILYPDRLIVGDVYAGSNNFGGFSFFGDHLSQAARGGTAASDGSWEVSNYIINPDAQATFAEDTDSRNYYDERIAELSGEGAMIDQSMVKNNTSWHLLASSSDEFGTRNDLQESNIHPEGKVWRVDGDLRLPEGRNYIYKGIGTIIVSGDLHIRNNDILPENSDSALGIIVEGKIRIENGSSKLRAAVLTVGDFEVSNSDNFEGVGSFMARKFNFNNTDNIFFNYDYKLESSWPPGFRYFKMPTAKSQ